MPVDNTTTQRIHENEGISMSINNASPDEWTMATSNYIKKTGNTKNESINPDHYSKIVEIKMNELIQKVREWGFTRGVTINGHPMSQTLKLGSEYGELCDNIAKGRYEAAKDDLGDMLVVMVMIAELIGTSMDECLNVAYNDIKDRKGYLNTQGVFVKEGDKEQE